MKNILIFICSAIFGAITPNEAQVIGNIVGAIIATLAIKLIDKYIINAKPKTS